MANDQDMLNDLNADDTATPADANTRILRKLAAANFFAGKIANKLTKVQQFLINGPPITPEIRTALVTLQTSAQTINDATTKILATIGSQ